MPINEPLAREDEVWTGNLKAMPGTQPDRELYAIPTWRIGAKTKIASIELFGFAGFRECVARLLAMFRTR